MSRTYYPLSHWGSNKISTIVKILQEQLNTTTLNIVELIKEHNEATSETKKKIAEWNR